ncbi:MAG: hypothetical protein QNJ33_10650 [Crocosphaera sp.]|nr:hypothetical protein [Crocosphaera sp.]
MNRKNRFWYFIIGGIFINILILVFTFGTSELVLNNSDWFMKLFPPLHDILTNLVRFVPIIEVIIGLIVHKRDENISNNKQLYGVRGIKSLFNTTVMQFSNQNIPRTTRNRMRNSLHRIDSNFIPGYLTKQSIFVALIIALILNTGWMPEEFNNNIDTQFNFDWYTYIFIQFLLFTALVFNLFSILCYDYSYRFKWGRELTIDLLKRGLFLDIVSFYAFLTAILTITATINPYFFYGVNIVTFIAATLYYFFNEKSLSNRRNFPFNRTQNTLPLYFIEDISSELLIIPKAGLSTPLPTGTGSPPRTTIGIGEFQVKITLTFNAIFTNANGVVVNLTNDMITVLYDYTTPNNYKLLEKIQLPYEIMPEEPANQIIHSVNGANSVLELSLVLQS